jgi:hypothetical protein
MELKVRKKINLKMGGKQSKTVVDALVGREIPKPQTSDTVQNLHRKIQDLDKQIKSKTALKETEHSRAVEAMQAGKKEDAKRHLQKEKRLDENISSLLSMQLILETQVNTIQSTIMQRDMISALDLSNNVLKNMAVSSETAENVMDNARESLETSREVADILNQPIAPEVDVSTELDQLLAVPPAPVPVPVAAPAPVDDIVLPAVPQQAVRVAVPA